MNKKVILPLAVVGLLVAGPASAALDVSAVTTGLADATTAVGTVGAAKIGLAALCIAYVWVKGFIFS